MNNFKEQCRAAQRIKSMYNEGDKIRIDRIDDKVYSKYDGQTVTVDFVDDAGQIFCVTEDNARITLCSFYGDAFKKVEPEKDDIDIEMGE